MAGEPALAAGLDLVWAVSGRGMLLRAIVEAAEAGLLPVRLRAVVTDRPCPIEAFAAERGIPVIRVAPPRALSDDVDTGSSQKILQNQRSGATSDCGVIGRCSSAERTRFDLAMAEAFAHSGANWAGLTFNRLIGNPPIEILQGRVLNVHFGLLPLFPGFGAIRRAVSSGMRVAGVTVHLVDETVDGGAILGQAVRGVAPDDTAESLGRRLFEAATPLLLQVLRALADGQLTMDATRLPVWSPELSDRADADGFPALDPDLAAFGQLFCARLS